MNVVYDKLWKRINAMGITRTQLRVMADLSPNTLNSISKNEYVHLETIGKICAALNCSIDDIVTVVGDDAPLSPLPEIDFTSCEWDDSYSGNDFGLLGIESLADFPCPITEKSIGQTLTKLFSECLVSIETCEGVISTLAEEGVHVQMTPGICPDVEMIKASLPDTEEIGESIEWKKVDNYVMWRIHERYDILETNIAETISGYQPTDEISIVESGFVYSLPDVVGIDFEGVMCERLPISASYPANLLNAIYGEITVFLLDSRMDILKEQLEGVLSTLTPMEEFFIRLIYQHGLSICDVAQLFDLPCYETIIVILENRFLNKALRKLRHPSRSRKLKDYFADSCDASRNRNENAYNGGLFEIKEQVSECLKQGKSIYDALRPFYTDSIASHVAKSPMLWDEIPDIKIKDMNLSWQLRLITKKCGMSTLKDIVTAHGSELSLQNVDESKLPFDKKYVAEILAKVQEYCPVHFEISDSTSAEPMSFNFEDEIITFDMQDTQMKYYDRAKKIVDLAEKMMLGDRIKPTIPFEYMHSDVASALVSLMYRFIEQLVSDYESGALRNKLLQKHDDNSFVDRVIADVEQVVTGKYKAHAFYFELPGSRKEWTQEPTVFQQIRNAYFADEQLNIPGIDVEKAANSIFPAYHFAFCLVRETRSGERTWQRIDQEDLMTQITETLTAQTRMHIEKMYISEPLSYTTMDNLFVCANADTTPYYFLFGVHYDRAASKMDASNAQKYMLSPAQGASLEKCIAFIEKLDRETDLSNWAKNFVLASIEDITLEEMNLTVRAYNCLKRAGINTAGEIARMARDDFKKVRNLGNKSIEEVEQWFRKRGITLFLNG